MGFSEKGEDLVGVEWLGEEESLPKSRAHRSEPVGLLCPLDPFGDDVELHAFAEVDDSFDQAGFPVVGMKLVDEGLVDLENVDRELLQMR